MSRLCFLFLLLILYFSDSSAQPAYLSGTAGCPDQQIYLYAFRGTEQTLFDSTSLMNGQFEFKGLTPPKGYYRLSTQQYYFDLIIGPGETPQFDFHSCSDDSVSVNGSLENSLLLELRSFRNTDKSRFRKAADSIFSKYPETLFSITASAYFNSLLPPENEQGFLSSIPFQEPNVVRTTVLPHLYMIYFRDYVNYDEDGFRHAADTLLLLASVNNEVYEFTLDFLLNLFHEAGPEIIFEYLVTNYYLDEGCADTDIPSAHIESYLKLRPGMPAPEVLMTDLNGNHISLTDYFSHHRITLLTFWSSHCPYCIDSHSSIARLSKQFGEKLGLIALSLDENIDDCRQTVIREKISWPVLCNAEGWDSEYARAYMVNKTPTFILVDQRGRIMARNVPPDKLEKIINQSLSGN